MRTIDADALKEDLKQYFSDGVLDSVSAKIAFNMILRKIDNAPTVETSKIEHKAYNEGFKDGVDQGIKLSERPQGE